MFFKDVVGHSDLKAQLVRMVQDGHVGHTLMFLGAEGSGNLPLALAFGGYILCKNPHAADRCGECPSCRQISALSHPDLHLSFPIIKTANPKKDSCNDYRREFIDLLLRHPYLSLEQWELESAGENKKSLIPVAEANEITRSLSLKSFMGGHKVMVIWMAEKLNIESANKLLKTLEEPTQKTIVILVVCSTEYILPTVISRSQLISLAPLEAAVVSEALIINKSLPVTQADEIARQSEGSYGVALRIAENNDDYNEYFKIFSSWMRACVKRDAAAALAACEQIAALKRDRQQRFMDYGLNFLHKSIMYTHVGSQHVFFSNEESDFAVKFAPYIAGTDLEAFESTFSKGHYHIERNANPMALFMKISYDVMRIFRAQEKSKIT
jgi:DNA polymerase-3 subunit delta'